MKNLLIAVALFMSFNSFAQEGKVSTDKKPEFKCTTLSYDPSANILELIGEVSFKSEILEFENADKIVWNRDLNEILVSGLNEFTIDGAIQFSETGDKKALRYTIGERIAYVE